MRAKTVRAVIRVVLFTVMCLAFVFVLVTVFGQFRFDQRASYSAVFTNVSGLKGGNFVRIAGVEVGKVNNLTLRKDGTVTVGFAIDKSLTLTDGTKAAVRYENLIGDRYLSLEDGPGTTRKLQPGQTIPLTRTSPALDVDALIGGFRPLFRALDPDQVNALSGELLRVFQGQGGTISSVLAQTSALTTTLADRDQLIGEVINNLNTVLHTFAARDDQFSEGLDKLSQLVQALADRKTDIANGVAYINAAAGSVADLLTVARQPINDTVAQTDRFAGQVDGRSRLRRRPGQDPSRRLPGAGPQRPLRRLLRLLPLRCDSQAQRQGRPARVRQTRGSSHGTVHTQMTRITTSLRNKLKRPKIKPLAERNRIAVGVVGILIVVALAVAVFSYNKIPFINGTTDYSAYFAEAGGIKSDSDVRVSGLSVGRVSDVQLDGTKVLVDFTVDDDVELGDRTEAAIKTETVLGTKMLELTPRGDGKLAGTIPIERTHSPYDLPTALGDLTNTISALDTTQLSSALTTLADTFKDTPPDLKIALEGVARFSDTLDAPRRAAPQPAGQCEQGHRGAGQAQRSDRQPGRQRQRVVGRASVATQFRRRVDEQPHGRVAADIRARRRQPDSNSSLPSTNSTAYWGSWTTASKELQRTLYLLRRYAMSFGEVLGSGPFFKASLVNLAPGQFAQPFIDAAFSDLGLDPNVLLPSQLVDPPDGQPGTPPLPVPYPAHRPGWRAEFDAARCDYRQSRRPPLSLPGALAGTAARRAATRAARGFTTGTDADARVRAGARRGPCKRGTMTVSVDSAEDRARRATRLRFVRIATADQPGRDPRRRESPWWPHHGGTA